MNLKKDLPILKSIIIELNKEEKKESIDVIDARKAYINARNMSLVTIEDYFLFFSSINLLNAYVKQDYITKKNYEFKNNIVGAIESLIKKPVIGINYCYNKSLTIVNIDCLQFSFHHIEISEMMKSNKQKEIAWEGIKLQTAATSIFEFANNLDNLTKKTFFGEELDTLYKESILGVSKDNPNVLEIFI